VGVFPGAISVDLVLTRVMLAEKAADTIRAGKKSNSTDKNLIDL